MTFPIALLVPILAEVGAPILKRLVAEHADGSLSEAGQVVIEALAARLSTGASPQAIEEAYRADPETAADAIRAVEMERRDDWARMLADINATMREEGRAGGLLQRIWRPVFGLGYAICFVALALTLVRALWRGDVAAINALAAISGFLIAFYGMGASVLGVYVWQRSAEKRAGAGLTGKPRVIIHVPFTLIPLGLAIMSRYAAKGLKKRITVGVLALAGALFVAGPSWGQYAPPGGMPHMGGGRCLNGGEMRGAVGAGHAKPLGAIMRGIGGGQIVRAKLCRHPAGLVYLVDVLKGARVEHLVIDARSGRIMMRR